MITTLARTIVLYIAVIASVRIMGKRQIGELQPSELVVTILISELAAIPLQDLDRPVLNGLISIFSLIILELILSALSLKFSKFRRVLTGRPAVVIKDGKIDQKMMRNIRLSMDDLMEALRQQNVFQIEDVSYAIVETNGKLSVLLRPEQQSATAAMLGVHPQDNGLRCVVIDDGEIQTHSLTFTAWNEAKIKDLLKRKHVDQKDVFLMMADKSTDYLIIKREK